MSFRKDTKAATCSFGEIDENGSMDRTCTCGHCFEVDEKLTGHEHNFYCELGAGVCCDILYSDDPLPDDVVAVVLRGRRIDLLDRRLAPEVPPTPHNPDQHSYLFRYYIWAHAGQGGWR